MFKSEIYLGKELQIGQIRGEIHGQRTLQIGEGEKQMWNQIWKLRKDDSKYNLSSNQTVISC